MQTAMTIQPSISVGWMTSSEGSYNGHTGMLDRRVYERLSFETFIQNRQYGEKMHDTFDLCFIN